MDQASSPSLIGRTVDQRYRVVRHLADGGMASVYLAVDQRLDRHVALKVMRPDLARDPAFVERFRREARSAARLVHPGIVGVYDQGEDGELVFLAMEFVDGRTLRQWIGEMGALTPRESLDTLDAILRALSAAHTAGIVHRDVKPENVLIQEDGTVKVADFGLARAVTATTSTATGHVLGTVAYLAPEQVERGIADPRSDVYAAGLLLFEMLTGRKALDGESPIHVAFQHVHGRIPAPSEQVPGLPAELDALVRWATQRDPDERPADAGALLTQLRASRGVLTADQLDARPQVAGHEMSPERTVAVRQHTTAIPLTSGVGGEGSDTAGSGAPPSAPQGSSPRRGGHSEDSRGATVAGGRRTSRTRGGLRALLAVLVLSALIAAAAGWFYLLGPGADRSVPNLAGKTAAVAAQSLAGADLGAQSVEVFNETIDKGLVVSTKPASGEIAKRGQVVTVNVSKGKERYVVPDLTGATVGDARTALEKLTLVVAGQQEDYSETVEVGKVLGTTPATGTSVKRSTKVTLIVSKGRKPFDVTSMVGKPLAEAEKAWSDAGIAVKVAGTEFSNTVPKDAIISQTPESGQLFRGDVVTVVVSKGQDLVVVPDVQGKQVDEAKGILEQAGFVVEIDRALGGIFGTAHSTNPGAGQKAPRGSTIVLRVV